MALEVMVNGEEISDMDVATLIETHEAVTAEVAKRFELVKKQVLALTPILQPVLDAAAAQALPEPSAPRAAGVLSTRLDPTHADYDVDEVLNTVFADGIPDGDELNADQRAAVLAHANAFTDADAADAFGMPSHWAVKKLRNAA